MIDSSKEDFHVLIGGKWSPWSTEAELQPCSLSSYLQSATGSSDSSDASTTVFPRK